MQRNILMAALVASAIVIPASAPAQGLANDFINSTTDVEEKLVGLASAMTPAQFDWRPAEGVRSVREVLLHVTADNYFIPAAAGHNAPAGIAISDYASTIAYEKQQMSKEETIAALKASFTHIRAAMSMVPDESMKEKMKVFGQDFTGHGLLVLTTTHLHEHLGQMIAYARMNGVKPPWSR